MMEIKEKIAMKIAYLLPKSVVKWCFFRMAAHATTGKWGHETPAGMSWETIAEQWPSQ